MTAPGRFFVDEFCPRDLVVRLRDLGHDVIYAADTAEGVSDDAHVVAAFAQERIIISADYGFSRAAVRDGKTFIGLVLIAPGVDVGRGRGAELANRLIRAGALEGQLTILAPDRIRRRPL